MTESFAEKMKAGTRELNITLSQRQLEQFFKYYEMLVETNKVMNLTAITEEGDVVAKHFCDSLCLVKAYHELLDRESEGEAKDMKTVSVMWEPEPGSLESRLRLHFLRLNSRCWIR